MSTKDKILKVAIELFCEQGFDTTTTRDICSKANCNVAAVNYHFKGKEGLGLAAVDYLFENYNDKHSKFLNLPAPTTETEWQKYMLDFIRNFIAEGEDELRTQQRTCFIFEELDKPSKLFHDIYKRYLKPVQNRLRWLIKFGLAKDASEDEVNLWFLTLISQCIFFRKKHATEFGFSNINFSDHKSVEQVTQHIGKTMFSGLKFQGSNNNEKI